MTDRSSRPIYDEIRLWLGRLRTVLRDLVVILDEWYGRRRPLTRTLLGTITGILLSVIVTQYDWKLFASVRSLGTNQLLVVIVGVAVGQTLVQTRTLNRIADAVTHDMAPETRTDGGNRTQENAGHRLAKPRTSGGGAIGGAIIGAGLGSSFGPGGTIAGVVIGAVLGDNFEELYL